MIGQIIFDAGGLGANRYVSGKLGMKLAMGTGLLLYSAGLFRRRRTARVSSLYGYRGP